MLNVFHHVDHGKGETLKGNPKKAHSTLKIAQDGKVEFEDVKEIAER